VLLWHVATGLAALVVPCGAGYALDVAHADNLDSWPWEPFVPKLSPRMAASSEGRQGPSPTHAATRASRGRAALTAATSSQRPRGAPRAAVKAGEQGSQAAPGRDGGVSSRLVVRPPGRGMRVARRAAVKQEDVDEAAIAVKPEEAEDPALVAVEALVPAQHTTEPSLQKAGTAAAAAAEDTQHTALGSPIGAQQLSGEPNGGGAPPPQVNNQKSSCTLLPRVICARILSADVAPGINRGSGRGGGGHATTRPPLLLPSFSPLVFPKAPI
jgi:hypothetical protein